MNEWQILALGLVLGVRHAMDADHLIAVSTIVSEYRNPLRAVWVGVSWGLGHTTTLFLAGLAFLLLQVHIPDRMALGLEFTVGVMLLGLGVQTFLTMRRRKVHVHEHAHTGEAAEHMHFHSHAQSPAHAHGHPEQLGNPAREFISSLSPQLHAREPAGAWKPAFRLKSYFVGTVHGLAGSAALMLLVLATIKSVWHGVTYILIFGLGTVVSMGVVSVAISVPFSATGRAPGLNRAFKIAAGTLSVVFGLVLMYEIGITQGLFS